MLVRKSNGQFVISLDFELLWGVMDSQGKQYHEQILAVHKIIPEMLSIFNEYDVVCTWGTVGAIMLRDWNEFTTFSPIDTPTYENHNVNPYKNLEMLVGCDEKLLFAPDLVKAIHQYPEQEFASHTYSHFYCLEKGQTLEQFSSDTNAINAITSKYNKILKSIIFPRNQFKSEYLKKCAEVGYISYRGNPSHWAYQPESREGRSRLSRIFRLLDAYIPISGPLISEANIEPTSGMVDVPASLFFRPWSKRLSAFESLKLWRIKWSMTQAAKQGKIFHLWWHPHNFGVNTEENLIQLQKILTHYKYLECKYNFKSITMEGVALNKKENMDAN